MAIVLPFSLAMRFDPCSPVAGDTWADLSSLILPLISATGLVRGLHTECRTGVSPWTRPLGGLRTEELSVIYACIIWLLSPCVASKINQEDNYEV
jgi:hypothetical protein